MSMVIPVAHEEVNLPRLIPRFKDMLDYCIATILECGLMGSMSYDSATEEIRYHLKITDADREFFPQLLRETEEIWIITTAGGNES